MLFHKKLYYEKLKKLYLVIQFKQSQIVYFTTNHRIICRHQLALVANNSGYAGQ